jgi:hypothetical protein
LLRERLASEVPELEVIDVETLRRRPGVTAVDPTHVLIETAPIGLTGYPKKHIAPRVDGCA